MASNDRETDRLVGENVRRLRADTGNLSQESLAEAMRQVGYSWSQATVWSVETGSRPIRLSEAGHLASIFRVPIEQLLASPERLSQFRAIENGTDEVLEAFQDLEVGATRLPRLAAELKRLADAFDPETDDERETVQTARDLSREALRVSEHLGAVVEAIADLRRGTNG